MVGISGSTAPQLILSCLFKVNNLEYEGKQGASAEGTDKPMHSLEFKALLCAFCPFESRPQMACKMYLSLWNMNLELPADALLPAVGCRIWLVEIRPYYNVKLPDIPPPHACSLKSTLQSSDVKVSSHIPWAKSLQLLSVAKRST